MSPQISQSAAMRRDDICLYVGPSSRERLEALTADRNTPSKVAWRAEIVLATADGHGTNAIMRRTGKSKPCVWRWQECYIEAGVEGLMRDKTRPSRKRPLPDKVKLAVLTKTANETPANATHWSRATMAAAGLPLKKGRAATMTHDYKRHGTTTLFAALDVESGLVIGECQPRHRAKEFIRFLKKIDRCVKKYLDVHLVLDNYGTHKTPEVKAWLAKHTRFKLHFTPTSASWLDRVERFFAEITTKRIRRGIFRSVAELKDAIHDYLDRHNADPKPFVWTKNADAILAKERRALDTLEAIKNG